MCFYHIRRLRQIRRRVGQEVTQQLVLALIMSRLDYCNSVLAGLPMSTLEPLQRVQNAATRLVFISFGFDRAFSALTLLVGWYLSIGRDADLHTAQLVPLPLSLASVKSRSVLPFWYRLTRVVPDKGPLDECCCCCCCWVASTMSPNPAALVAGQLQNKVRAVLPHPYAIHYGRSST